jgi:monoamine oxidase
MALSRRTFLTRIGHAGGFGAAYVAMQGLGLLPIAASEAESVNAAPGSGNGVKVVVLGGGIAGQAGRAQLDGARRR